MAEANGMDVINKDIASGEFARVYLLGGEEKYLLAQYKQKLVESLIDTSDSINYGVFKGDNSKPDSIVEFGNTMPFFADRRVLLVEGSDFFKKGNDDIAAFLDNIPDTTIVIFVEDNIDKRNKLYKLVSKIGKVALFSTPNEKTLLVWLKSLFTKDNIKVEDAAIYRLIEGVGSDMSNLYNEAEKLKCYCIDKGMVSVKDVDDLCISQAEGKIFDMMDALSKRDKDTTVKLYDDLIVLREPYMRILYLITRQFNILLKCKLAVENGKEGSQIASVIKIPPFTVKKYINQSAGYTYSELLQRVNWCQETDSNIKSGKMRDNIAVDMLIMKLLQ